MKESHKYHQITVRCSLLKKTSSIEMAQAAPRWCAHSEKLIHFGKTISKVGFN